MFFFLGQIIFSPLQFGKKILKNENIAIECSLLLSFLQFSEISHPNFKKSDPKVDLAYFDDDI
jgi:hypothetical protein